MTWAIRRTAGQLSNGHALALLFGLQACVDFVHCHTIGSCHTKNRSSHARPSKNKPVPASRIPQLVTRWLFIASPCT